MQRYADRLWGRCMGRQAGGADDDVRKHGPAGQSLHMSKLGEAGGEVEMVDVYGSAEEGVSSSGTDGQRELHMLRQVSGRAKQGERMAAAAERKQATPVAAAARSPLHEPASPRSPGAGEPLSARARRARRVSSGAGGGTEQEQEASVTVNPMLAGSVPTSPRSR